MKQVSLFGEKEGVTSKQGVNKVESANVYIWIIRYIKPNSTLLAVLERKLHQLATPSAQVLLKSTANPSANQGLVNLTNFTSSDSESLSQFEGLLEH